MCMCEKCGKMSGFLVLLAGVLFLLQDLLVWNFWNIQWYTVVFLIVGLSAFASSGCPQCKEVRKPKK